MAGAIAEFLQHIAERSGSAKSTVLKSLGWLLALLLSGSICASRFGTDKWFVVVLGIFVALTVVIYLAAFIYFALTDSDALRSERFTIQKMAIQKGFIGDDTAGYIKVKPAALQAIEDAKGNLQKEDK